MLYKELGPIPRQSCSYQLQPSYTFQPGLSAFRKALLKMKAIGFNPRAPDGGEPIAEQNLSYSNRRPTTRASKFSTILESQGPTQTRSNEEPARISNNRNILSKSKKTGFNPRAPDGDEPIV
jgi:hypothetical protein